MDEIRLRILPALVPNNGKDLELRATDTYIQWRYVTDDTGSYEWTNLIAISEISGDIGPTTEMQSNGTYIQYRPEGTDLWTNLVALTDLEGPQGEPGPKGDPGGPVAPGEITFDLFDPDVIQNVAKDLTAPSDEALPTVATVKRMVNRPKSLKAVLISDIQPDHYENDGGVAGNGGQVAKWDDIRAGIESSHGLTATWPADELHVPGDLVDRGLPALDAPQDDYGFADLFESLRGIVGRDRIFSISGNHDYEYPDQDESATAKSFTEYEKYGGPPFYYRTLGNLVFIHMGDMHASVGGVIPDYVFEWWLEIVETNRDKVVICETHQALYDCGLAASTTTNYYVWESERFTDWMTANPGVVALWISGHYSAVPVGGLLNASVASQSEAFGCHHVNVGLHIPSYMEDPNNYPMSYCVMYLEDGSDEIQIERWNVETNAPTDVAGKNFTVSLARPVELAAISSFDGRFAKDRHMPHIGPHRIVSNLTRYDTGGGVWAPVTSVEWLNKVTLEDRHRDNIGADIGVGTLYEVPGDVSEDPAEGTHSYGVGGGVAVRRASATDDNYSAYMELYVSGSGQDVDSLLAALALGTDRSFYLGPILTSRLPAENQALEEGVSYTYGEALSVARSQGTALYANRYGSTGQALGLQYDGTTVGGVDVVSGRANFRPTPSSGVWLSGGSGSPEGAVSASPGSLWLDATNGVAYMKKSGTGNTGWKLITQAA